MITPFVVGAARRERLAPLAFTSIDARSVRCGCQRRTPTDDLVLRLSTGHDLSTRVLVSREWNRPVDVDCAINRSGCAAISGAPPVALTALFAGLLAFRVSVR